MRYTFHLPGSNNPEIAVENSHITPLKVFVDGVRQPRLRRGGRPTWEIATLEGITHRISFRGTMTGLRAVVDDTQTIELERRLTVWELVLVVLPIGLIGLGPNFFVGGLVGLFGVIVNLELVRRPWLPVVRVAAMLVVFLVAFAAWYFGEIAIALLGSG